MHCNFFFASWFLSIWFPHRLRNRLPTNPSLFIWSNCLVSHLLPYAIFEPITCSRIGTCWHTDIYLIEIWWKFTRFFSSPQLRSFLQLTSGMRFFLSRLFISCTVNTFEEFHSATCLFGPDSFLFHFTTKKSIFFIIHNSRNDLASMDASYIRCTNFRVNNRLSDQRNFVGMKLCKYFVLMVCAFLRIICIIIATATYSNAFTHKSLIMWMMLYFCSPRTIHLSSIFRSGWHFAYVLMEMAIFGNENIE